MNCLSHSLVLLYQVYFLAILFCIIWKSELKNCHSSLYISLIKFLISFCILLFRFDPPIIPNDFVPHHKFPGPLETLKKLDVPSTPEVPPPDDSNLKLLIEGVAKLVARCGKLFEDLSRKKNQSNPLFSFLSGGDGHDYYERRLWEEHQKLGDQAKLSLDGKHSPSVQKMTAEGRGKLLGEKPLERSSKETTSSSIASTEFQLQFNLSDTFKKPDSFVSTVLLFLLLFSTKLCKSSILDFFFLLVL